MSEAGKQRIEGPPIARRVDHNFFERTATLAEYTTSFTALVEWTQFESNCRVDKAVEQ